MTAHSKVGFSSRKRWKACPGSVRLSEGMTNESSKFAEEGTAAHALLEHCLRSGEHPVDWIGDFFKYDDHGAAKTIQVAKDMSEHLTTVVDAIRVEIADNRGAVMLLEERFHLTQIHPALFGTGDVAIWFPERRRLQVRDLKYGAGIAVDIESDSGDANEQLEGYGLGALLKFPEWKPVDVELVIDQPRAYHADGPTRRKVLPVAYFIDMAADLYDEVLATEQPDAPLHAGDHCRFCPAAAVCPLLKTKAQETAKKVFAADAPYDAAELAQTLEWLPILEGWIKNTREFAYAEAVKGHDIPAHKLVEKVARRKWRDVDTARVNLLCMLTVEEAFDPATLKTPAAIEKLLSKDQRRVLDELCIKESSGHTLVHASDKREAVKVDAASAFAETP